MIVGVLGGGQLGWMLGLAGRALGARCRFLDPNPDSPARHVGDHVVARFDDGAALQAFATGLAAVTYEFENVPVESARALASRLPVMPAPEALATAQDRLHEKEFFHRLGVPTPRYRNVRDERDLLETVVKLGLPTVLKTRRLGYDGRGQTLMTVATDLSPAWEALRGVALIAEEFVPFDRELSLIAVRGRDGDVRFYPLVENHHREGILRVSLAPAPDVAPALQAAAESYAKRILTELNYVGVLAMEWFERSGELLANEMAPRVHNSGHWTIEGAATSQFENHLRALVGRPLDPTDVPGVAAMINLIGEVPDLAAAEGSEGVHVHRYGKSPRPKRKMGHVTVTASTREELLTRLTRLGPVGAPALSAVGVFSTTPALDPRPPEVSDAAGTKSSPR